MAALISGETDTARRSAAVPKPGAPGTQTGAPRLDMLRDAHISLDGQGGYYLTGTAGTFDKTGRVDFDHNRGAPLWHSTDLKTWKPLGYAWDRVEHFRTVRRPKLGVWLDWGVPEGRIDGLMSQATTAPRLYHINKGWYLLCAMNDRNVLLQKSSSGKAGGPYRDYAYLVTRGPRPSLFVDDERIYLVYAEGWIARLKPDLLELAEPPRPLQPRPRAQPGAARLTLGDKGVALFRRGDTYYVLAPRWTVRDGKSSHDAFLWKSTRVYGPYEPTGGVITGSGPASVFRDARDRLRAVCSGVFEASPRIVPIPFD
jgi:beta-xylosidase